MIPPNPKPKLRKEKNNQVKDGRLQSNVSTYIQNAYS